MKITQHGIAWLFSILLALSPVMTAQAAMIGNGTLIEQTDAQQTRDSLQQLLARQEARQQLLALGVNPAWVMERTSNLSESELARINRGIEQQQAGGDSVLGVLLLIFIVFVITDVIGATDIFPFIHPVR